MYSTRFDFAMHSIRELFWNVIHTILQVAQRQKTNGQKKSISQPCPVFEASGNECDME